MAMSSKSLSDQSLWPVQARWRQEIDSATLTWRLEQLCEDRSFWGEVLIKTPGEAVSDGFSGEMPVATFDQIHAIIEELDRFSKDDGVPRLLDELLGIGTGGSFRRLVGVVDSKVVHNNAKSLKLFRSFVELIQPVAEDGMLLW